MKWEDAIKFDYPYIFRGYLDNDGEYVIIASTIDKNNIEFYRGNNPNCKTTMDTREYGVEKYNDWLPGKTFDIGVFVPDEQMIKLCYFRYKKLLKECKT